MSLRAGRPSCDVRAVLILPVALLVAVGTTGCERGGSTRAARDRGARPDAGDSLVASPPAPPPPARPALRYVKYPIRGQASITALHRAIGDAGMRVVFEVNRRDLAHFRDGDTLVVPDPMPADDMAFLDHSPLPLSIPVVPRPAPADPGPAGAMEAAGGAPPVAKTVLVSLASQAFGAYENGRLVRWGAVSTGRRDTPTPPGFYHANWKDRERFSTVNEEWHLLWVVNLDSVGGISMHQYAIPGYPASHSCIRLLEHDAVWLYHWIDPWELTPDGRHVAVPGTPVVVFGEWKYGQRGPWRRLPDDPQATSVDDAAVRAAMAGFGVPTETDTRPREVAQP